VLRNKESARSDPVVVDRRTAYASAAVNLLDQHRRFCEPDLLQFLQEVHPEIPEEHRFALMIGAMAGDQTVAQLHMFAEYNRRVKDEDRLRAANKMASISDWNFGLRVGTRSAMPVFHNSRSVIDPYDPASPEVRQSDQPPSTTSLQRYEFAELHLPVEFERSNADFAADAMAMYMEGVVRADTPPLRRDEPTGLVTTTSVGAVPSSSAIATSSRQPFGRRCRKRCQPTYSGGANVFP